MRDIDYILEFVLDLGAEMIGSGANLERVNGMMLGVTNAYGLHDVTIFTLNSILMISAKDADDYYTSRQLSVPAFGIHLERLKSLNQLYHTVCSDKPQPLMLRKLLVEAYEAKEYPLFMVVLGQVLAALALSFIFAGTVGDAVSSCIIIAVVFAAQQVLAPTGMNKILQNVIIAWLISCMAVLCVAVGAGTHFFIIVIVDILIIIPGIPMVNAMRNLLCGNEMNAVLQFSRVILESIALVAGVAAGMEMFGRFLPW